MTDHRHHDVSTSSLDWDIETVSEAIGEMGSGDRHIAPEDAREAWQNILDHFLRDSKLMWACPDGTYFHREDKDEAEAWVQNDIHFDDEPQLVRVIPVEE